MIFSLGFMNPRVLRGRSLSSSATASRWFSGWTDGSMPLGKYWRRSPEQGGELFQPVLVFHAILRSVSPGSPGLRDTVEPHARTLQYCMVEYQLAEATYDGEACSMAVELGVTMQVLRDYRMLLERRVRYGAEMVGQQP